MKLKAIIIPMLLICTIIPAHADRFQSEFLDCTIYDGFVTNVHDSTGPAKECLQMTIPSIPLDAGPPPKEYTNEQIAEYCMQYESNPDFEQKCIDDYLTSDKHNIMVGIVIAFFIGFVVLLSGATIQNQIPTSLMNHDDKSKRYYNVMAIGTLIMVGSVVTFAILLVVGII